MSCCQKSGGCQPPQQPPSKEERMGEGQEEVWGAVQNYYGEEVKCRQDLQTSVCERATGLTPAAKKALSEVHPEVIARYYGCGLVIPEALEGCSVLDLGCGTGRDVFVVSKLVTASGRVVGVDMTPQQLAVARQYVDYHRDKFGFSQANVEFLQGHIEKLGEAGLQDNTFDIIISNCVINLCPDKGAVLKEAFRVLKEGGELYFSDVYTDTHLTPEMRQHRVLWGECVSGALHWEDLYTLAAGEGFSQPRLVSASKYNTDKFTDILGGAQFVSATYRLFKTPPNPTPRPPAVVVYKGGIEESPDCFKLDGQTSFQKDCSVSVDGELAAILSSSRFKPFFTFDTSGDITPTTGSPKVDPFQCQLTETQLCCA